MNNTIYKQTIVYGVVLLLILTAAFAFTGPVSIAEAVTQYTDVMADLEADENFNAEDYPAYEGDYNLKVIQIAESESSELFIYVYQPSYEEIGQMRATSIVFSTTPESPSFKTYGLRLLSQNGVFSKYVVDGFLVPNFSKREYAITEIFRNKKDYIDKDTGDDNNINEIACEVAQKWTAMDYGDTVIYAMDTIDVVTIVHQWGGEIYMNNGCDLSGAFGVKFEDRTTVEHFVSFRCNYEIDHLYEAEVSFVTQDVMFNKSAFVSGSYNVKYGPKSEPKTVVLHDDHYNSNSVHGIGGRAHTWPDIETVDAFQKRVNCNSDVADKMKGDQYVLSFYTSTISYKYNWGDADYDYRATDVLEVAILRLKFDCKGKTLNLGVVGNKQTSDGDPDNDVEEEFRTAKWFFSTKEGKSLIAAFGVIFVLAVIVLIVIALFKLFPNGIGAGGSRGGGGGTSTKTDIHIDMDDHKSRKTSSKKKKR